VTSCCSAESGRSKTTSADGARSEFKRRSQQAGHALSRESGLAAIGFQPEYPALALGRRSAARQPIRQLTWRHGRIPFGSRILGPTDLANVATVRGDAFGQLLIREANA
jgi:hypothetical protein